MIIRAVDGVVEIGGWTLTPDDAEAAAAMVRDAVVHARSWRQRQAAEAERAARYAEADALEADGWLVGRDERGAVAWHPGTGALRTVSWRGAQPMGVGVGRPVPARTGGGRVAHEVRELGCGWSRCIHCGTAFWPVTLPEAHTMPRCAAWQRASP